MVRTHSGQRGVTYLALLLAVAIVSAVLAANATLVSQAHRREREVQLLWAGDQLREALLAYARAGDGRYPDRLEDLLEDPRSPAPRRFLRQVYADPMTRGTDWGLLRDPSGGIVGVHSRSTAAPIKTGGFAEPHADFAAARTYADWKFAAAAPQGAGPQATPARAPGLPQPASAPASAAGPASDPAPASPVDAPPEESSPEDPAPSETGEGS